MEPNDETPAFTAGPEEIALAAPTWPAPAQSLPIRRSSRRGLRVALVAVIVVAVVVGLGVTALVQASQRRHANKVVASTQRELATTQQQLDQARAAVTNAQDAFSSAQSEADAAQQQLDDAKNVFEPILASEAESNLGVGNDVANCIAHEMLKQLTLAQVLQTDASPEFMKAVFLAEAQCVTSAPTA